MTMAVKRSRWEHRINVKIGQARLGRSYLHVVRARIMQDHHWAEIYNGSQKWRQCLLVLPQPLF